MTTNLSKFLKKVTWILVALLDIFLFENELIFVCFSCTERERSDQLPEKYPWLPRLATHHYFGPSRITVPTGDNSPCEFPIFPLVYVCMWADYKRWIVTQETIIFCLPPDHCSSWNSRHIRAEVSHCWGCLRFYETAVIGVGGMGQIYSCLWRTATGWPGNRAVMHDGRSVIMLLLIFCHALAYFYLMFVFRR